MVLTALKSGPLLSTPSVVVAPAPAPLLTQVHLQPRALLHGLLSLAFTLFQSASWSLVGEGS